MAATKIKGLLHWCRRTTQGYEHVQVENFTTSWKNGLAFCAIIHRFRPDLIDYDSLLPENVFENCKMVFQIAEEELDIPAFLDARDMARLKAPDKLSVITYVSEYYNALSSLPEIGGPGVRVKVTNKVTTSTKRSLEANDHKTPIRKSSHTEAVEDTCSICQKRVYLLERHQDKEKLYHRACFRHSELSPTNKVYTSSPYFSPTLTKEAAVFTFPGSLVTEIDKKDVNQPNSLTTPSSELRSTYKGTEEIRPKYNEQNRKELLSKLQSLEGEKYKDKVLAIRDKFQSLKNKYSTNKASENILPLSGKEARQLERKREGDSLVNREVQQLKKKQDDVLLSKKLKEDHTKSVKEDLPFHRIQKSMMLQQGNAGAGPSPLPSSLGVSKSSLSVSVSQSSDSDLRRNTTKSESINSKANNRNSSAASVSMRSNLDSTDSTNRPYPVPRPRSSVYPRSSECLITSAGDFKAAKKNNWDLHIDTAPLDLKQNSSKLQSATTSPELETTNKKSSDLHNTISTSELEAANHMSSDLHNLTPSSELKSTENSSDSPDCIPSPQIRIIKNSSDLHHITLSSEFKAPNENSDLHNITELKPTNENRSDSQNPKPSSEFKATNEDRSDLHNITTSSELNTTSENSSDLHTIIPSSKLKTANDDSDLHITPFFKLESTNENSHNVSLQPDVHNRSTESAEHSADTSQSSLTSENVLIAEMQNVHVPTLHSSNMKTGLRGSQQTGTNDTDLLESQQTGTKETDLVEPQQTGTKDIDLMEPQQTGTKDTDLLEPQQTGTNNADLLELQQTGTKDTDLLEPQQTGTKDTDLLELQQNGTKDTDLLEPQQTGTKYTDLMEPQQTGTNDTDLIKSKGLELDVSISRKTERRGEKAETVRSDSKLEAHDARNFSLESSDYVEDKNKGLDSKHSITREVSTELNKDKCGANVEKKEVDVYKDDAGVDFDDSESQDEKIKITNEDFSDAKIRVNLSLYPKSKIVDSFISNTSAEDNIISSTTGDNIISNTSAEDNIISNSTTGDNIIINTTTHENIISNTTIHDDNNNHDKEKIKRNFYDNDNDDHDVNSVKYQHSGDVALEECEQEDHGDSHSMVSHIAPIKLPRRLIKSQHDPASTIDHARQDEKITFSESTKSSTDTLISGDVKADETESSVPQWKKDIEERRKKLRDDVAQCETDKVDLKYLREKRTRKENPDLGLGKGIDIGVLTGSVTKASQLTDDKVKLERESKSDVASGKLAHVEDVSSDKKPVTDIASAKYAEGNKVSKNSEIEQSDSFSRIKVSDGEVRVSDETPLGQHDVHQPTVVGNESSESSLSLVAGLGLSVLSGSEAAKMENSNISETTVVHSGTKINLEGDQQPPKVRRKITVIGTKCQRESLPPSPPARKKIEAVKNTDFEESSDFEGSSDLEHSLQATTKRPSHGDGKQPPPRPPPPSLSDGRQPPPRPPPPIRPSTTTDQSVEPQQLSAIELHQQLLDIDGRLTNLELRGRNLEESIRNDTALEEGDDSLITEWFSLVTERNELVRREQDLAYISKQQELEDEQEHIERQLRYLLNKTDKTYREMEEEGYLIDQKLKLVKRRSKIIESMEEDRMRYESEDKDLQRWREQGVCCPLAQKKLSKSKFYS